MNRLSYIKNLCKAFPIKFCFISGKTNPADCITRCLSYKLLIKTNYISGPNSDDLHSDTLSTDIISIVIPNP